MEAFLLVIIFGTLITRQMILSRDVKRLTNGLGAANEKIDKINSSLDAKESWLDVIKNQGELGKGSRL